MNIEVPARKYLAHDKLRDGREFAVRIVGPEDKAILSEVMHHLSPQSRYFRYLTLKDEPTVDDLALFADVNVKHHLALVAFLVENGETVPIGLGEYFVNEEAKRARSAELAFAVEEEYQGMGVATALLRQLAEIAQSAGIAEFTALVHPDNRKMLEVFAHCGLAVVFQDVFAAVQVRLKLPQAIRVSPETKVPA
jgi:acetyltransferase